MADKKLEPKIVGSRWNAQELPVLQWLAEETGRKPSSAMKWATIKVAKEMGYVAVKKK